MRITLATAVATLGLIAAACTQTSASNGTPTPTPVSLPALADSTLHISAVSKSSLDIGWAPAYDPSHPSAPLRYSVYRSDADNISTLGTVHANGTLAFGPAIGVYATHLSGLSSSSDLWFNVTVTTSAGIEAVYQSTQATTKTPHTYLFATYTVPGSFGGRVIADGMCSSMKTFAFADLECTNVRGFVGTGAVGGQIVDFPLLFGVPAGQSVVGPTGLPIANDWNDLTDGSVATSMRDALGITTPYWTGADSSGVASNACFNGTVWNDASSGNSGQAGDDAATTTQWLDAGAFPCNSNLHILCVCW